MSIRFIGALTLALVLPAQAQQPDRPATLGDHPNLNGVWQALGTAHWNLEAHSAEAIDVGWPLGAIAAVPAGKSVVREGTIPYLPEALAKRDENRANWPAADPEAKCYMLGVPRVTYHDMPFQIFQGDGDLLMVYPFAATNRVIYMNDDSEPFIESWMGKSSGHWDGDTLVVVTVGQNDQSWLDRAGNFHSTELKVTERFTPKGADHLWYEATLEDPQTYARPWTIEMPLYRHIEPDAQLLEHKCVPFADKLLYQDLMGLPAPQ
ncbi:MAG TPA: hypothetical protein VNR18_06200 [Hyphomicrobiales bacterium]|nr:hypothetical protein [Hyphomicrobiales bacterium]